RRLVSQFGDALRQAGYNEGALRRMVGSGSSLSHDRRSAEIARRRIGEASPLRTLLHLFCLGILVPESEVENAFGPAVSALLLRIGVVSKDGTMLKPLIAVDAADQLLIAHDAAGSGDKLPMNHVIGLGPAPRTLA